MPAFAKTHRARALVMLVCAAFVLGQGAMPARADSAGRMALGLAAAPKASPSSVQTGSTILTFGDSLTQGGQDSTSQTSVSWPYEFQLLTGLVVQNSYNGLNQSNGAVPGVGGIGGQTSTQIAKRQGGVSTTLTFGGNVLNTGSNSVTAMDGATPTNATGILSNPSNNTGYSIKGTVCTQHGNLVRTSSGGPPSTTETYTFTPDSSLSSFSCAANSTFVVDNLALASQPIIIEAGRNDFASAATVEANIAAMYATCTAAKNNKCVVLSIPNGEGEGTGTSNYIAIMAINSYLAATYGSHFLDWRAYMVSQYDATNPVDVVDHTNDIPPYSLRAVNSSGTITSAITTTGQTSFTTSNSLSAGAVIKIGSEYILITATSGTSVTAATRGYGGSTAATYSSSTAFTGTDFLHWSAGGYTAAARYLAANDAVFAPVTNAAISPSSLQAQFYSPPVLNSPNIQGPVIFTNIGSTSPITLYGSVAGVTPLINFKNQGGGGTAAIGASGDGNQLRFLGTGANIAGFLQTGASSALTLSSGEVGLTKITASGTAPGAAGGKIALVCGTNAGTAKLIAYAGTSTTATTILDNVGSGVTGC